MKFKAVFAMLMIFCCHAIASGSMAESTESPEVGLLTDDLYLPRLDNLCGVGERKALGCQAIRNRKIADKSILPWAAIGRVNFSGIQHRQHCTGTLLSERVVLTAAHCLYNFPRKSWIPPQSARFVADYQMGTGKAVSKVARYVLDPVHDVRSRNFTADLSQDWALLVLEHPVGGKTGFLSSSSPNPDEMEGASFVLAGYAGLRPHVLTIAEDCGDLEYSSELKVMLQNCAAMHGDSGAPVLANVGGKEKVVGVFVGTYFSGQGLRSASIPLSSIKEFLP